VKRLLLLLMAATTMILVTPGAISRAGSGTVRMVDGDGRAQRGDCEADGPAYRRIQDAIDASELGDRILVCPGTYTESLIIRGHGGIPDEPICDLTIRATGEGRPVIRAPRVLPTASRGVVIRVLDFPDICGGTLTMAGFRVQPHGGPGDCIPPNLISVLRASLSLRDMRLVAARPHGSSCGSYRRGVDFDGDADYAFLDVTDSVLRDFSEAGITADDSWGGALAIRNRFVLRNAAPDLGVIPTALSFGAGVVQDNVIFSKHGAPPIGGIEAALTYLGSTIGSNVISGAAWGIRAGGCGTISDNVLLGASDTGPGRGIVVTSGYCNDGEGWQVRGNVVTDFARSGIVIREDPQCPDCGAGSSDQTPAMVIRRNDFRGNGRVDCMDATIGTGSMGTANEWTNNLGFESDPAGICDRRR
jgi:hypothetical protein